MPSHWLAINSIQCVSTHSILSVRNNINFSVTSFNRILKKIRAIMLKIRGFQQEIFSDIFFKCIKTLKEKTSIKTITINYHVFAKNFELRTINNFYIIFLMMWVIEILEMITLFCVLYSWKNIMSHFSGFFRSKWSSSSCISITHLYFLTIVNWLGMYTEYKVSNTKTILVVGDIIEALVIGVFKAPKNLVITFFKTAAITNSLLHIIFKYCSFSCSLSTDNNVWNFSKLYFFLSRIYILFHCFSLNIVFLLIVVSSK